MTVRMRRARVWQDAGRDRALDAGAVVTLPAVVAMALLADGSAEAWHAPHEVRELAVTAPVEVKVKRRRRA